MKILEELWYGNIEPSEYDTSSCKDALKVVCRNEDQLKAILYRFAEGIVQTICGQRSRIADNHGMYHIPKQFSPWCWNHAGNIRKRITMLGKDGGVLLNSAIFLCSSGTPPIKCATLYTGGAFDRRYFIIIILFYCKW